MLELRDFLSGDASGWLLLGKTPLTLQQIADAVARRNARNRAAAHFFLGRRAGSVFYRLFPPSVSPLQIAVLFVLLTAVVTAGTLACSIASDPLRKAAGLHRRRLAALVDSMERELTIVAKRAAKRTLVRAGSESAARDRG